MFSAKRNYTDQEKEEQKKPRPIKIELPNVDMKKQIFKGCRNLKNCTYSHVSIQNYLAREEQEINFKLRQELKQRKAN